MREAGRGKPVVYAAATHTRHGRGEPTDLSRTYLRTLCTLFARSYVNAVALAPAMSRPRDRNLRRKNARDVSCAAPFVLTTWELCWGLRTRSPLAWASPAASHSLVRKVSARVRHTAEDGLAHSAAFQRGRAWRHKLPKRDAPLPRGGLTPPSSSRHADSCTSSLIYIVQFS
jgi:hypothetical protein